MRADKFFADKYSSRTKCAEAIEKGLILVNGKPIKPKDDVKETDTIIFVQPKTQYVSNGGYKLERAIEEFPFSCQDKIFVDIGASTGGFTDCLLQNGAKKVYAIDVGESLLDAKIARDLRVVVMDNTNARYLEKEQFNEEIDGVVTDVSFISLRLIFPTIKRILKENGDAIVLVKPQFECEGKHIGKSGIVHTSAHVEIVKKVIGYALKNQLYPFHITSAPLKKGKNIEYVLRLKPTFIGACSTDCILEKVKNIVDNRLINE